MAPLDIAILAILGISMIRGLWKGLISQLIGIVSLVMGAWSAMVFSTPFGEWLSGLLSGADEGAVKVISYIAIFVIVMIGLSLLGKMLEKIVKLVMLGWLNRLLGALVAAVVSLFAMGMVSVLFDLLFNIWASVNELSQMPAFISESKLYEPIHNFGSWVFPFLGKLTL